MVVGGQDEGRSWPVRRERFNAILSHAILRPSGAFGLNRKEICRLIRGEAEEPEDVIGMDIGCGPWGKGNRRGWEKMEDRQRGRGR